MRIQYLFSSRHTRTLKSGNKHRKSVPSVVADMIRICDVVLEVLDARFIDDTRNIEIEKSVIEQGKRLIYLLNKSDLVDITKLKEEAEKKKLFPYIIMSSKSGVGKGKLMERIKIEAKRGLKDKKFEIARVGLVGYPNTGKSTMINFLTNRHDARTSAKAGFTKGLQKISLAKNILLLDTPGIIPAKEDSKIEQENIKKHTKINVETYDRIKNPELAVSELMKSHAGLFESYYNIKADGDSEKLIEEIGKKNNFMAKGGIINTDRAARLIIKEWQFGKIRAK
jgi:ribosome biogenesis GTPase A